MFSVPVDPETAFTTLRDIKRAAGCMSGASVDRVDGDGSFTGEVELRRGPLQLDYRGEGRYVEVDQSRGRAVFEARGWELRGNGTARAAVSVQLEQADDETGVYVDTDLHITGRPAQIGRGVLVDVSDRLLATFVDCLRDEISGGGTGAREEGS